MSPTYEFKCSHCEAITEGFFSMSSVPDEVDCVSCKNPAERVISGGSGFILEGTGWARDRYTGDSNRKDFKID